MLFKDIKMFGGFAGLSNPANPDERDPLAFLTILEGDVLGNDIPLLFSSLTTMLSPVVTDYRGTHRFRLSRLHMPPLVH